MTRIANWSDVATIRIGLLISRRSSTYSRFGSWCRVLVVISTWHWRFLCCVAKLLRRNAHHGLAPCTLLSVNSTGVLLLQPRHSSQVLPIDYIVGVDNHRSPDTRRRCCFAVWPLFSTLHARPRLRCIDHHRRLAYVKFLPPHARPRHRCFDHHRRLAR